MRFKGKREAIRQRSQSKIVGQGRLLSMSLWLGMELEEGIFLGGRREHGMVIERLIGREEVLMRRFEEDRDELKEELERRELRLKGSERQLGKEARGVLLDKAGY